MSFLTHTLPCVASKFKSKNRFGGRFPPFPSCLLNCIVIVALFKAISPSTRIFCLFFCTNRSPSTVALTLSKVIGVFSRYKCILKPLSLNLNIPSALIFPSSNIAERALNFPLYPSKEASALISFIAIPGPFTNKSVFRRFISP